MAKRAASSNGSPAGKKQKTDAGAKGTRKKMTIIGIGRLGLCTALCCERAGYDVLGVDVFPSYVEALNNKSFESTEPRVKEFLGKSTHLRCTTSLKEGVDHSDVLFLLVDTPSTGGDRHYDTSKVARVLAGLNKMKIKNKHIIIGCTVMPGYIDNIGKSLISDCVNTSLSYNPEFIQQGNIVWGFLNPDMVLIGEGSKEAGDFLEQMYVDVCESKPVVSRMSPSSAEITKIALNCFITTKITFANMIGDIADKTPGANKNQILKAVGADKRVGGKCLMPGYGYGGPCFPRDNRALGGYATSIGIKPVIPLGTDEYNKLHAVYQVENLLKDKEKKKYTFEDVAYKPQCPVPIVEESQKLHVAAQLARAGKHVTIKDRDFIVQAVKEEFGALFTYEIENGKAEANVLTSTQSLPEQVLARKSNA